MSFDGFTELKYERLAGLMTFPFPEDIAQDFSPNLQNVRFKPGAVMTRPGLGLRTFTGFQLYGLAQFIDNSGTKKQLIMLDANTLYTESTVDGSVSALVPKTSRPNARMKSALQFNRIFHSFFQSLAEPSGPARHYDGTNLDLLTPEGPAGPPTAADSAGAGTVAAGLHKIICLFECRSGYVTEAGEVGSWTAAGAKKVDITNAPIGPSWVRRRKFAITAAGALNYFHLTTFIIDDNTTTTATFDFDDDALQKGENYNPYFRKFRLPEVSSINFYNNRCVATGELNTIKARNLTFDGGFDPTNVFPLGWTATVGGGAKESSDVFAGDAYKVTGDGATPLRGHITIPMATGLAKLTRNTAYSIGFWVKTKGTASVNGFCSFWLSGTAILSAGTTILATQMTSGYVYFEGPLCTAAELATIPADLILNYACDGPLENGAIILADHVRIWPTLLKYQSSVARVSNALDGETFDGLNGFQYVTKDDGQKLLGSAPLGGYNFYLKEHSCAVTNDDGLNPPSLWAVTSIDNTVGTAGPNAFDFSKDFIVTASRQGAYVFFGPKPMKLSQEIQTANALHVGWEDINWTQSHKIHTLIDSEKQRVYFYVPIGTETEPQHAFVLDYSEGWGTEENPGGRKWGYDEFNGPITASIRGENYKGKQSILLAQFGVYLHDGKDISPTSQNGNSAIDAALQSGQIWTNPSNGALVDSVFTSAVLSGNTFTSTHSHMLQVTFPSFNIPTTAEIAGFVVQIYRKAVNDVTRRVFDYSVRLALAGAETGDNKADLTSQWPTVSTVKYYGGPTDGWNAGLTVNNLNSGNFQVSISVTSPTIPAEQVTAMIDGMIGTVYYYDSPPYNDAGAQISQIYESAPRNTNEDDAYDLFGGIAATVIGAGTLFPFQVSLDNVVVEALGSITLATSPGKTFNRYGNTEAQRVRIRLTCGLAVLNENFQLKRLSLYAMRWAKQDPQ